jgi:hypothetical protein
MDRETNDGEDRVKDKNIRSGRRKRGEEGEGSGVPHHLIFPAFTTDRACAR